MNQESRKIKSFTQLNAWKEGHELVLMIYEITKTFPKEEVFGLISQLRRCAISVTSNIAEGFSRQSYKEKLQFYSMALGSVTELQNQILVAKDIKYISQNKFHELSEKSITKNKIINALIKSTKTVIRNS